MCSNDIHLFQLAPEQSFYATALAIEPGSALIKIATVSSELTTSCNFLHFSAVEIEFVNGPSISVGDLFGFYAKS